MRAAARSTAATLELANQCAKTGYLLANASNIGPGTKKVEEASTRDTERRSPGDAPPPRPSHDPVRGAGDWKFDPQKDLDWRGREGSPYKNAQDAMGEAFKRTGVPREEFEVTKWGKDAHGKSFPTEYRVTHGPNKGAEVNIDIPHSTNGPAEPHVGYQTPGKRLGGGAQRGHIILDEVPYGR